MHQMHVTEGLTQADLLILTFVMRFSYYVLASGIIQNFTQINGPDLTWHYVFLLHFVFSEWVFQNISQRILVVCFLHAISLRCLHHMKIVSVVFTCNMIQVKKLITVRRQYASLFHLTSAAQFSPQHYYQVNPLLLGNTFSAGSCKMAAPA